MANNKEELLSQYLVDNQVRFYRLAVSYLHNREEALDAVQTAVCHALEKQDSLRQIDAMAAWFSRILVNTCTDTLRRRKRLVFLAPEDLDAGSYEDPLPEDGSLYARVDALPPEIQTIVKLRFYEELSLKEISEVTGWNVSTVKTRLYSGLRKLRVSLEGAE
ncbi:MAG: RNA polymerase sigma factor [Oscillibacter sp.]